MIMVSLCLIVKNEEQVLARCLDCAGPLVEEIIVVDTGSTDGTKAIAASYGAKVYDFIWIDDFAAARNESFAKATQDYIFWLDADDILNEEAQREFLELKKKLASDVDSVTMPYYLAFDEYGNVSFSLRRHRLVRRERNFRWRGQVHEYLEVQGKIVHSNVIIIHQSTSSLSDRNLKIYENKLKRKEEFTPRDLYYYANELFDHLRYAEAIVIYEKFLSQKKGWLEDNVAACGKLADCYNAQGDKEGELRSILRPFGYDSPRAEFCCRLGYHFLNRADYLSAIFWYRLATQIKQDEGQLGFFNRAYSTWLPHLQLCVCYSKIGAYKLAYLHNEMALQYRPRDATILNNKEFLKKYLEQ